MSSRRSFCPDRVFTRSSVGSNFRIATYVNGRISRRGGRKWKHVSTSARGTLRAPQCKTNHKGMTQQESKSCMDDGWDGEEETGERCESAARWREEEVERLEEHMRKLQQTKAVQLLLHVAPLLLELKTTQTCIRRADIPIIPRVHHLPG